MKLIDKDALTEKLWERRVKNRDFGGSPYSEYGHEDDEILSLINALEVKEVDLEKHLKEDIEDVLFDLDGVAVKGATHYLTVEDVKNIAKHFFELGIAVGNKAQKGE